MDTILGSSQDQLRRDRTSVKWVAFEPDVLPVWVAEMDAAPCPAVVDAVTAAVRRGDTGYDFGVPYAQAASGYAAQHWGWSFDHRSTMGFADVMIGIEAIVRTVTGPGDTVIVSPPVYDSFYGFVTTTGRPRLDVPLTASGRLDLAALEAAFAAASAGGGRAAYLLCNPHNPTGTVHTRTELTALAELAAGHHITVISDEIHAPLVYPGGDPFTPYLTVADEGLAFAVWSASKAWNLAGFKAAVAVAGPGSLPDLARIHEVHTHGVGHIGSIAHIAAFTQGQPWLEQVITELDANRRLLADLLARELPDVAMAVPDATYLAWLDCRGLELGDNPAAVFLERGRVALSAGPHYGAHCGRGFARFNFATSPEIIAEAVSRMAASLR
mgnify:CR=1 FL=1